MKVTSPLIASPLVNLIEEIRDAEISCNWELTRELLETVCPDLDSAELFENFPDFYRAELLRLAGYYFCQTGRCRSESDFLMKGKDLMTHAIRIFDGLELGDKSAEAKIMLALCYWYSGEVEECELILRETERSYSDNKLHPVYLRVRINRMLTMIWSGDSENAVAEVEALKPEMEMCSDRRLLIMFHNQAGLSYEMAGDYSAAAYHMNEAIRKAREAGNDRYIAVNQNNLAMIYRSLERFNEAYAAVEESLNIFRRLNDIGWQPHVLDTQALIHLEANQPVEALKSVNEALTLFTNSGDFSGLADSLFTKCRILMALRRKTEALNAYVELQGIAGRNIGISAVHKFQNSFAAMIDLCPAETSRPEPSGLVSSFYEFDSPSALFCAARDLNISAGMLTLYFLNQHQIDAADKEALFAVSSEIIVKTGSHLLFLFEYSVAASVVEFDPISRLLFVTTRSDMIPVSQIKVVGSIVGYCNDFVSNARDFTFKKI